MPLALQVAPHPLAYLQAFESELPGPLGDLPSPPWLQELLTASAAAPLKATDIHRSLIRDLLRHGGYKPTGRGKPASEYLLKAAAEGLASINLTVDLGNIVSLHSGIPISVVDLSRTKPPLRVELGKASERYVFNASGQEIDVEGLLCLFDTNGPCANAVKDAQRTKTQPETRHTLTVFWGAKGLRSEVDTAASWWVELAARAGVPSRQAL